MHWIVPWWKILSCDNRCSGRFFGLNPLLRGQIMAWTNSNVVRFSVLVNKKARELIELTTSSFLGLPSDNSSLGYFLCYCLYFTGITQTTVLIYKSQCFQVVWQEVLFQSTFQNRNRAMDSKNLSEKYLFIFFSSRCNWSHPLSEQLLVQELPNQ